jgi:hypothetical protein
MKNCGPDFPRYVGVPELMHLMKKLVYTVRLSSSQFDVVCLFLFLSFRSIIRDGNVERKHFL